MEAERKSTKQKRQVSEKRTPFNIKEEKRKAAAEERENSPNLQALYNAFMPGARGRGMPKYMTDKYGSRIRTGVTIVHE